MLGTNDVSVVHQQVRDTLRALNWTETSQERALAVIRSSWTLPEPDGAAAKISVLAGPGPDRCTVEITIIAPAKA